MTGPDTDVVRAAGTLTSAGPSRYELRLQGHLDGHWSAHLGGLSLAHEDDGSTTLRGTIVDQSALFALLHGVRDLGATLISLTPVPDPPTTSAAAPDPSSGAAGTPLARIVWPVRTDRLLLRPATARDAAATWPFRRLPEVNRWLTRSPASLREHRAHFEDPTSLAKTVVVELDDRVVGDLMLQVEDAWGQAEVASLVRGVQADLGWALHPEHSGRGYATEAVRRLLGLCFRDLGLRRVTAQCFSANEPSWRLMERVGMRRELHAVRESLHRTGEWLDVVGYALLDHEWCDRAGSG